MAVYSDILLRELDLEFKNGDMFVGESDEQHIELILLAHKGQFRDSPITGVGITRSLQSNFVPADLDTLKQRIRLQLEFDGFNPQSIRINSFNDFTVEATR